MYLLYYNTKFKVRTAKFGIVRIWDFLAAIGIEEKKGGKKTKLIKQISIIISRAKIVCC